jgi:glutathione synthase/RimK-type ligase-like ATP-grasp enzyme
MPPVILATCAALPDGDEDAALLLTALERAGVSASWQEWTDTTVDWTAGLTVIRSTWDYTGQPEQFLAWTRAVPRLANPANVIEWSSDKTYLADVSAAGVPIVPTVFAQPGESAALPTDVEYVVKPSIGAGSRGAGRFAAGDDVGGRAHVEMLHAAGRTVLVQPYLVGVDTVGETALLYFDGQFSHAISKGAMLPEGTVHPHDGYELYVEERITPHTATEAELAVGAKAIAVLRERFGQDLLYTRVDLLPGPDGPVVIELEVAEPSVFLGHDEGAAGRFAAAIAALA